MHLLISPAKTLDMNESIAVQKSTLSPFIEESAVLIKDLKKLKSTEIQDLMKVSSKIAELNAERFHQWALPFNKSNAKAAIYAFKGDVYTGLDADTLSEDDLDFAQNHLSILSGLYGLLRPLDLMQAYRLEMGTKFANTGGKNLYEFWGNKITEEVNKREQEYIINLASNEYYKVVQPENIKGRIVTINFKEWRRDAYRFVSFSAKKARGLMARYMIDQRIEKADGLKDFDVEGYAFNPELSTEDEWIFTRHPA